MIYAVIGAVLTALFTGLLAISVRYGSLRLSELPALLWCLLSGPDHRRQLRGVLLRREQRPLGVGVTTGGRIDPQVAELHAAMDDLAERATARLRPCVGCSIEAWHGGKCPACYQRAKRERKETNHA